MRIFGSLERSPVLVGDVAYFRIVIESRNDADLMGILTGPQYYDMKREMEGMAKQTLGPEFEVRSMTIGRGSVEVVLIIATTYYIISKYKNFIESLELLKRQIISIFRQQFPTVVSTAEATWTPGPALSTVQPGTLSMGTPSFTQGLLLLYLIFSHAGLLVTLVWLLLKKLS
jgi:hypothetical protein